MGSDPPHAAGRSVSHTSGSVFPKQKVEVRLDDGAGACKVPVLVSEVSSEELCVCRPYLTDTPTG